MKYRSTRGNVKDASFEEALFTGYASDGGILLPDTIPVLTQQELSSLQKLGFIDIAKRIIPYFVSEEEIPKSDLEHLIEDAYKTFSCPEVAPVARLKHGVNILELFHGKTWTFKDVALSCVGQFMNYFCSKRKEHHTVIVGTSGDTGSAAIEAVRGLKWVDIVVLLPRGRCTEVQERQMTTVIDENVHVFRVDGTSDDIDLVIKPCFMDARFCQKHKLTSINSINWSRIMVQIVHYFYAYFQMSADCESIVEIVVPTGACGNVTAGCIASKMGLPIRLVCAVTCNDIVSRAISQRDFSTKPDVTPTLAPAMDIQIPYNMERIWYIFSGGDSDLVTRLMEEFDKHGSVEVPENLSQKISKVVVDTFVATDTVVKETMKQVWEYNFYLVCPHTAIAVAYVLQKRNEPEILRICLATASPVKFEEAIQAAGIPVPVNAKVSALLGLPTRYVDMEKGQDWEKILKDKIIEIYAGAQ